MSSPPPHPHPPTHLVSQMQQLLRFDWRKEVPVGQLVHLLDPSVPSTLLKLL